MTTPHSPSQIAPPPIRIRGARTHNLKDLSLDIPAGLMTVITGLSGSGKSSLLFNTLYAEGFRRFLKSQLRDVGQISAQPLTVNVDSIEGLPPVIGVWQEAGFYQRSIRSTLSTLAGLDPLLRLLWSRLGTVCCPQCGQRLSSTSINQSIQQIMAYPVRTKAMILVEVIRNSAVTSHNLEQIQRDGFVKIRLDGELTDLADLQAIPLQGNHRVDIVVDRIIVKAGIETRLRESLQNAFRLGDGRCQVSREIEGTWIDDAFHLTPRCDDCNITFPSLEPSLLSFNSPQGACLECGGLGVVPHASSTHSQATRLQILNGDIQACPICHGTRLNSQAQSILFNDLSLSNFSDLDLETAHSRILNWYRNVQDPISQTLLPQLAARLEFLITVGLVYLSLSRSTLSLSGGEFQRARLGAALGTGLTGACYLIDEPTTGLHSVDRQKLIESLRDLLNARNTVITVEHDLDFIRQADWLIDLGPGAGKHGGEIVAQGTPSDVMQIPTAPTGIALKRHRPRPSQKQEISTQEWMVLSGAHQHNLKHLTVSFPLQQITVVVGVSGSGKSSLVMETLVPILRQSILAGQRISSSQESQAALLTGHHSFQRLLVIDQWPLGKSPLAMPATLMKIWGPIRNLLSKTRIARQKGFSPSRFSFRSLEGQCPACQGKGYQLIRFSRDNSELIDCTTCLGKRFNPQTLAVRFHDYSLSEILSLSCQEALDLFGNLQKIRQPLEVACQLGLGYLQLGQPAHQLSGGEAQRLKLASELSMAATSTLFVMDEPTTGLHPLDVDRFLDVCRRLQSLGNTVIILEHHLDIIAAADHIIELGPVGGPQGGHLIFSGSPHELINNATTPTARAFSQRL